ncbi:MAG: DUF3105 domain-containing protein [Acidimicrobiales bacterium]
MSKNAGMNAALRPILLVVSLAVVAVACGGSDDDGAATTDSGVTMPAADDESSSSTADTQGGTPPPLDVAIASIEGIEVYEDLGRDHVDDPTYDVRPPPGGDHLNQWESCGFFSTEIVDGNAVHSLEHGAVWVAYRPDIDPAELSELESLANVETHLLVSPYSDLETPLMLVAWGLRLPLDSVEDERFDAFLSTFIRGPQTPEPGVACRV